MQVDHDELLVPIPDPIDVVRQRLKNKLALTRTLQAARESTALERVRTEGTEPKRTKRPRRPSKAPKKGGRPPLKVITWEDLTPQQQDILTEIGLGYTINTVAEMLSIPRTRVRSAMKRVLRRIPDHKYGRTSEMVLVARWVWEQTRPSMTSDG